MEKETGAMVFIVALISLFGVYHVPIIQRHVVTYGALVALLGILLALFLH